ncbi:nucleolar protein 12-like [Artemia franciscana]|uniref:Nucleolar protein 12 n=1 Tax=Artemia franciscana TaxID=6661 RepID=A0AA88HVK9_ARTSF|nr:hypothetical protein QYM36_009116 [Artemia franciscana]
MRGKRQKNRATKTSLTFDEKARRDFLNGFHKRKVERKLKYKKKLEEQVKAELKKAKREAQEKYALARKSQRTVPEVAHLVEPIIEEKEDATVTITDLSGDPLSEQNVFIGPNKTLVDDSSEDEAEEKAGGLHGGLVCKSKKQMQKAVNKKITRILHKSKAMNKKKMEQTKKNIKKKKQREKLTKRK